MKIKIASFLISLSAFLSAPFFAQAIIPSDTYFQDQWYLKKIKAPEAWELQRESPEIVIAILDSGVQINHPDLAENIWQNIGEAPKNGIDDDKNGYIDDINGWDFINNSPDPGPKFNTGFSAAGVMHGTVVAGIAAAAGNNATGISGVTWRAKIMSLKVLNDAGEGRTDKVVEAINYAINNGADIINLSFTGFGLSRSLEKAIEQAHKSGIIIVAAAGNEQDDGEGYSLDKTPMYPVCHDGPGGENWILGVAATDTLDQKTHFSSFGFNCVDIAAPGVSVLSTAIYNPAKNIDGRIFNEYYDGYWSGTSMAVPMVSGAAALVEAANPALSKEEIIKILLNTGDNISRLNPNYLGQLGRGRVNIKEAVKQAQNILKNTSAEIITVPQSATSSLVQTSNLNGKISQKFLAYDENFQGGANLVSCNFEDKKPRIITGAGFGGGPQIKIFNSSGDLENQFFAYGSNFRGGVNIACGDLNNDGFSEIITGAGFGGGPQVRVFDQSGKIRGQFFAYDPAFRGGVNIAVGDIDGDKEAEIITAAGKGGGPHIRIFNSQGHLEGQFWAFEKNFRGGVNIAVGNTKGGARSFKKEIIIAPGQGWKPEIKIFDNAGKILKSFLAFNEKFQGGVNVAAADLDQDGIDDIVAGAGLGGGPHVRSFNAFGKLIGSFYAYSDNFTGGVSVGTFISNTSK